MKYLTQKEVEATVEEAKLRHALRAVMTEMEELDSEKTAEMQRAREQVPIYDCYSHTAEFVKRVQH